ncbi:aminoacyl-tRNA hydrolase [bacterium]|nr:aminoacyl-tRNA hydrolase [bacterium]
MSDDVFLIVGLGNPGAEYVSTRHNFGFVLADCLNEKINSTRSFEFIKVIQAEIAFGELAGKSVCLLKPLTFMNRSGGSLRALLEFQEVEIDPHRILVIHDDLDLELGRIKLKGGGGSGGHNGVKSLIEELGSADFLRLRLGIGGESRAKTGTTVDFVLAPFAESELRMVDNVCQRGIDGIIEILNSGVAAAMNLVNRRVEADSCS